MAAHFVARPYEPPALENIEAPALAVHKLGRLGVVRAASIKGVSRARFVGDFVIQDGSDEKRRRTCAECG